jgi:hypothetical protein
MHLNVAAIVSGLLTTATIAAPSHNIVKKASIVDISE